MVTKEPFVLDSWCTEYSFFIRNLAMWSLGYNRIRVKPISIGLGLLVIFICITFFITLAAITWVNKSNISADFFYRPYEKHRMRVRPIKKHEFPMGMLEPNDYEKLNNLTDFQFRIIDKQICDINDAFLLVMVSSSPNHFDYRLTIRQTWGHTDRNIIIMFLLASVEDYNLQNQIKEENSLYNDIVQGSFLDSYRNLTYKTIMSLKFAVYHCPQTKYILKIDDDAFVNMPLLRNFLRNDISPFGAENLFLCNDMTGSEAIRDNRSKFYVSKDEFSGDVYPSYCSGWYSIFSPDVAFQLYRESQKLKYLSMEDAFVYGVAAREVQGLGHTDFSQYTLTYRNQESLFKGDYDNVNIIFGKPNMDPSLIKKFWDHFREKPIPLSIYRKSGII